MTKENSQKLQDLFQNSEFLEKFSLAKEPKQAIGLLADYGVEATENDLENIAVSLEKAINIIEGKSDVSEDSLSEEELDTVAGGTIPPQAIIMAINAIPYAIKGIKSLVNLFKKKKKSSSGTPVATQQAPAQPTALSSGGTPAR